MMRRGLLEEQFNLDDTGNTLLYQIREEARETNRLLRLLVEKGEEEKEVVSHVKGNRKREQAATTL